VKYGSPSEVVQWKQTAYDFFGRKWLHIKKYFRNGELKPTYEKKATIDQEIIQGRYEAYLIIQTTIEEKEKEYLSDER
jgi:hypothetical protein